MARRAKLSAEEIVARILSDEDSDEELESTADEDNDLDDIESLSMDDLESDESSNEAENNKNSEWQSWRNGMSIPTLPFTVQNVGVQISDPNVLEREIDYFQLFFSDELLMMIVTETNRYATEKLSAKQLGRRSIWNTWNNVSLAEMKAYCTLVL